MTDPDCALLGDLCYTWHSDVCAPRVADYQRRLAADPVLPTETWTVGRVVHYRTTPAGDTPAGTAAGGTQAAAGTAAGGTQAPSVTVTAVDPPECRNTTTPAPAKPPPVTGAVVARAFAIMPLPVPTARMSPPFPACVHLNVPNYVYVDPVDTAPITVTLLGTPVTVYPRVIDYTWDFGDGQHLTTTDPGAPYPDGTVSHIYRHPGRYPVTVTVRWAADWHTPAHPRSPVPGQAATTSPPGIAWAHEVRVVLVDDPAATFPAGPHDPADACYPR